MNQLSAVNSQLSGKTGVPLPPTPPFFTRSIRIIDLANIPSQSLERNGLIGKVLSAWELAPENGVVGPIRRRKVLIADTLFSKIFKINNLNRRSFFRPFAAY